MFADKAQDLLPAQLSPAGRSLLESFPRVSAKYFLERKMLRLPDRQRNILPRSLSE
jgi:hypothetical protein